MWSGNLEGMLTIEGKFRDSGEVLKSGGALVLR